MQTYHREIYWPFNASTVSMTVTASRHASQRAEQKGFTLPDWIMGDVFEASIEGNKMVKCGIRIEYSNTHDLCLVVSNTGMIITAWLNSKSDKHNTLDASKYVQKTA
jgi:hypothetical protein